ncbi:MAG TPA: hypothetical protein PK339_08750 [Flavitalea sp.]|nr:hypothetical protein [Flavitalea sp.]
MEEVPYPGGLALTGFQIPAGMIILAKITGCNYRRGPIVCIAHALLEQAAPDMSIVHKTG